MQPLSVVGPDASRLVGALASRFDTDGRVAVVELTSSDGESVPPESAPDAATSLAVGPDGSWVGTGTGADLDALLDRLAPDHDYLFVAGETRLRLPTIVLGEPASGDGDPDAAATIPGDVILSAPSADDVDLDAVEAVLEDAQPWITLAELRERVKQDPMAELSGAIATFTGRVRSKDAPDDDPTTHLEFEAYEGVAEERMDTIAGELEARDGVFRVLMHHRTGVIENGEDIVFVVVLAGHREEAFRTVEDGINRLKDEVPIFKKESTDVEEFWVHQRE